MYSDVGRPPGRPAGSGLTIFLAEDDAVLRSMLAIVLRRDGHRVVELRDGADLYRELERLPTEAAERGPAMLVVADLRMPVMDTLTVMRGLRTRGQRCPFILMTAFGEASTHVDARALGAVAVFDKPFDFDELRGAVRAFQAARARG